GSAARFPTAHPPPSVHKQCAPAPPLGWGLFALLGFVLSPFWPAVPPGAPPLSRHSISTRLASPSTGWCQFTATCPLGLDSAPYFTAFVTSSRRAMATACVTVGVSVTSGPPLVMFAEVE